MKRGREEMEELEIGDEGQPRKKTRQGWAAQQWITVYNKHRAMKQRYEAGLVTRLCDLSWMLND